MLNFFPEPYPNELIANIFYRYHIMSGNYSKARSMVELLERNSTLRFSVLSSKLAILTNNVAGIFYSPDYFIYNHTIFPFYSPFLTLETQKKVLDELTHGQASRALLIIGETAVGLQKKKLHSFV